MVVLRATRKVLRSLPATGERDLTSDTALGDWYVNRLVIRRKPLLLLVSSESLLAVLTPARDVRSLPDRLPAIVGDRLRRLDVADSLIDLEIAAMEPVLVAPTVSRSVLGTMVDFGKLLPYYLPASGADALRLQVAETKLAKVPCRVAGSDANVIWPEHKALELLEGKSVA